MARPSVRVSQRGCVKARDERAGSCPMPTPPWMPTNLSLRRPPKAGTEKEGRGNGVSLKASGSWFCFLSTSLKVQQQCLSWLLLQSKKVILKVSSPATIHLPRLKLPKVALQATEPTTSPESSCWRAAGFVNFASPPRNFHFQNLKTVQCSKPPT